MIFTKLKRQDLANCSRVNKQWHRISIPYLWNDISSIPYYSKDAFRRIVLEDYLHEQQRHAQYLITNNLPTTLQKYSHWIQKLPSPEKFGTYFEGPRKDYENDSNGDYEASVEARRRTAPAEAESATVTAVELMRHLLRRCVDVDVDYVHLGVYVYDSPDLSAIASEYFLPLAQNVTVGQSISVHSWSVPMEARRVKSFLSRCSHKLRKLKIGYHVPIEDSESDHTEENNEKENMEEEESTSGLRPIELILAEYCERSNRKLFSHYLNSTNHTSLIVKYFDTWRSQHIAGRFFYD